MTLTLIPIVLIVATILRLTVFRDKSRDAAFRQANRPVMPDVR